MARTIKKRMRNGSSGGAAAGKVAANACSSVPTPGIQELQDLMDAQQDKISAVKAVYSQQNTQFAKSNSALLMKLTDFEKKISELVQENVVLRSRVSVDEYTYKERLNEQISILEEGISRRFEEIFHMFDSIRRKENLPSASTMSGINMERRSTFRSKRSRPSSGRTSSIHFQDTDAIKNKNTTEDIRAKKKRKSSRRESIFMPGDFDFAQEEYPTEPRVDSELALEPSVQEPSVSEPEEKSVLASEMETVPLSIQQPSDAEASEMQLQINEEGTEKETRDASLNFTNSIIDYSIPEETATGGPNSSREAETPVSSSKLEIFRDEPEQQETNQNYDPISASKQDGKDQSMTFMPLEASQNKVKHSMRPMNTKSKKKIVDEVMPSTSGNVARDLDFPRTRRTRGKAIDYTLPSLRAKMRRPSEKLVDATTFTNIQDLQVSHSARRSSKESSRKTTISPEPLPDLRAKSEESEVQKPQEQEQDPREEEPQEQEPQEPEPRGPLKENMPVDRLKESNVSHIPTVPNVIRGNDTQEKRPNSENENNSQDHSSFSSLRSGSSGSSGKALKDITNTPKVKQPPKTKKLFKNAIINDLCDKNASERSQNSNNDRNVSFRLQEDDLSVFDLIGADKVKCPQKTYRAKSRRKV